MVSQEKLEEIRAFFDNDRYAIVNGAHIEEVGEGYAKCSMTLTKDHLNAVGGIMGGAPYTLADFTFAVATNWQTPKVVTLSSTIQYIGTAKGTKLIATAECLKEGRSAVFYRVFIEDDLGRPVAEVSTTGFIKS